MIAHGSRLNETYDTINEIAFMLKEKLGATPLEVAYLEFNENNIEKAIKKLYSLGVTEIKAVPYFLFNGVHMKNIPIIIQIAQEKCPGLTVTITETLGADPKLAEILFERVNTNPK